MIRGREDRDVVEEGRGARSPPAGEEGREASPEPRLDILGMRSPPFPPSRFPPREIGCFNRVDLWIRTRVA